MQIFATGTGVYDTGFTPFKLSPTGQLENVEGLYGAEASLGAYGRHSFRRSVIGLDYNGNYRHYVNASNFNGSNHQLSLGYSLQKSRRLAFDFTTMAGTQSFGTAFVSNGSQGAPVDSTSLLFDNRTSYLQGGMSVHYAVSNRTVVTMGGLAYKVGRQAASLVDVNGYTLTGEIRRRVGRDLTVGASYQHLHYDFPQAFGESDINMFMGTIGQKFGRTVTLQFGAGVFRSEVQGVQQTALDPVISALLGVGSVSTIFYRENTMPVAQVTLGQQLRRWSWGGYYTRSIMPGNGVFLTSRQEMYGARYSYTGIRKLSLSADVGASNMTALGQQLQPLKQYSGTAALGYQIGAGLNFTAVYARRHQDLTSGTFRRESSRIAVGIGWNSGNLPISFR